MIFSLRITFRLLCLVIFTVLYPVILKAQIAVKANTDAIGKYDVYELVIEHLKSYPNNWDDVIVSAAFSGPDTINVNGFYYDSNTWKVRFAPPQTGNWSYKITFTTPTTSYTANGSLMCVASNTKGFLQRHPKNPFRLIYPNGELFNGMALGDCMLDFNGTGTPNDNWGIDGDIIDQSNSEGRITSLDNYMKAYGSDGAGFNMFRWSTDNCSFRLYNAISPSGNNYGVLEGKWGDSLVVALRNNKMRLYLVLFGPPVYNNINGSTPLEEAALKRYISYVIARYGAYADIWELFNESHASDHYIKTITSYIRSIDPYHRLISISDEQPQKPEIDINSPHWYEKESELESDIKTWERILGNKKWNKPIIFGEQGNAVQNWDPLSAERMRIRSWAAFFAEGMFVFWNTSTYKNYMHEKSANIYLGAQERSYIRSLQDYTSLADSAVTQIKIIPKNPYDVRAYGLHSKKVIMAYFHHYTSHGTFVNTSFQYRMRQNGKLYWINPADNKIIDSANIFYGNQLITSPAFNTDLAMRIELDQTPIVFDVNQKLDLIAYPNPATTEFYIDGNFNGTAVVELYNTTGRKVFQQSNVNIGQRLSTTGIAQGVYFYRVHVDQRQATGKLVIL
jgi:hypothetical protein